MQQPLDSSATLSAPTPILYGQVYAPDTKEPSIVRDARILCILALVLYGIFIATTVVTLPYGGSRRGGVMGAMSSLTIYVCSFLLALFLYMGLKRRVATAWRAQIFVSILGLLGFPIGTLIHGLLLSRWFKPEVKSWFNLPAPPEFNR